MLTELIARGGPVMYVLLGCSLVAVAIIIERAWFWLAEARRINKRRLSNLIFEKLNENIPSVKKGTFLEHVTKIKARGDHQELARLLRRESERTYERSTKFLSGLDTVVSIAPLLGILGTVLGIMKSFHALDLQHMTAPGEVGHGLAEAMLTTASGLAIAVPTLVFYNLFHSLAARHAATLFKLSEDISDAGHRETQAPVL